MDREGRTTEDDAGRSCRLQVGVACISDQTFWWDPGGRKQKICCILNHHGCFKQFPVIYCHYLLFVYEKHIAMKSSILSLKYLLCVHGISQLIGMLCPSHKPWMVSLRFSARTNSVRASPRQEMAVFSSHTHILLLFLLPVVTFSAPASPVANSYLPPPPETDSEVLAGEQHQLWSRPILCGILSGIISKIFVS